MSCLVGALYLFLLVDLDPDPGERLFQINQALGLSLVLMGLGGFLVVQAASAMGGTTSQALPLTWPLYPLAAFPLLLVAGQWMVQHPGATPWLFPLVNITIVAIPSVAAGLVVARRYTQFNPWCWPVSWREWTSGLIYGAAGATIVAGVLNTLYFVIAGELFVRNFGGEPRFPLALSLQTMDEPWGIIFDLSVLSIFAPLNEELWKGLLVAWFFFRRGSAGRCFLWGALAGAGFNLFETFSNSVTVVDPDIVADERFGSAWWMFALARSGTAVMHGAASGLAALGFYGLFRRRWHFVWFYFAGVAIHSSWNFLVYAVEGDALFSAQGPDTRTLDVLGVAGLILVAAGCAFLLWEMPRRVRDGAPAHIYRLLGAVPPGLTPAPEAVPKYRRPSFFDSTMPGWEDPTAG